ncbi:MAG TPA: gamma-glutamylcyclotransferase [Oscillatoriaceae cyanobacterium M33_DOE_052]|uniref:Gamma-glutamylcyclotransferase n=1 Tax=Planktothricoides sp. SpSt-374 TaxID=2282167 RepID=A0A7C3VLA6_9CYAN|nr:gamma-glutamylcyclotransferase [Oscillatoriaceae cyanobacterium M33_DOE_052]
MLTKVFVYGTLKPGERYHHSYCSGLVISNQPANARGKLYHLKKRGYPAMTEGEDKVRGFVLSFPESAILLKMDELENYKPGRSPEENEYDRRQIEVFHPLGDSMGLVWAYVMSPKLVRELDGVDMPDGWWSESRLACINC